MKIMNYQTQVTLNDIPVGMVFSGGIVASGKTHEGTFLKVWGCYPNYNSDGTKQPTPFEVVVVRLDNHADPLAVRFFRVCRPVVNYVPYPNAQLNLNGDIK